MIKKFFITFAIFLTSLQTLFAATLKVTIHGIDPRRPGQVYCVLYDHPDKFMTKDYAKAVQVKNDDLRPSIMVDIDGLRLGVAYSLVVFHDENMDKNVGFNRVGMQLEGVGFGRHAERDEGVNPDGHATAIMIDRDTVTTDVKIEYP